MDGWMDGRREGGRAGGRKGRAARLSLLGVGRRAGLDKGVLPVMEARAPAAEEELFEMNGNGSSSSRSSSGGGGGGCSGGRSRRSGI